MSLVRGAIAPHGGIVLDELCTEDERRLAQRTRTAMEDLGRRFSTAGVDSVVVLTPHGVHLDGHMAVVTARQAEGDVAEDNGRQVRLRIPANRELALTVRAALAAADVPVVGVSFGGNDPDFQDGQVMPLDWGALIPLWYLGGRRQPPTPAVIVSTCRELGPSDQLRAGAAVGKALRSSPGRTALVASADHGHAHAADGPYGFDPAAKEYDELVQEVLRSNRLGDLEFTDPKLVDRAKADSWWQLLVLAGALGPRARFQILAYEAPTYFGMLVADAELASEGS